MTSKPEEVRVDDLVMIRFGAAQRLHIAHLEEASGELYVVRKYLPGAAGDDGLPGAWARHTMKLPRGLVLPADPDDPRLEAAKVALSASGVPAPRPKAKRATKKTTKKRAKKKARKTPTKKTTRRAPAPVTAHPEGT